jgi:hypothetical protein
VTFARDTYTFNAPCRRQPSWRLPQLLRADDERLCRREANGKSAELQRELEALFESQNKSAVAGTTSIPATFLRVTATV